MIIIEMELLAIQKYEALIGSREIQGTYQWSI